MVRSYSFIMFALFACVDKSAVPLSAREDKRYVCLNCCIYVACTYMSTYMAQNQDAYCTYVCNIRTYVRIYTVANYIRIYVASHGNIFRDHKPFKNYIVAKPKDQNSIKIYICIYVYTTKFHTYVYLCNRSIHTHLLTVFITVRVLYAAPLTMQNDYITCYN